MSSCRTAQLLDALLNCISNNNISNNNNIRISKGNESLPNSIKPRMSGWNRGFLLFESSSIPRTKTTTKRNRTKDTCHKEAKAPSSSASPSLSFLHLQSDEQTPETSKLLSSSKSSNRPNQYETNVQNGKVQNWLEFDTVQDPSPLSWRLETKEEKSLWEQNEREGGQSNSFSFVAPSARRTPFIIEIDEDGGSTNHNDDDDNDDDDDDDNTNQDDNGTHGSNLQKQQEIQNERTAIVDHQGVELDDDIWWKPVATRTLAPTEPTDASPNENKSKAISVVDASNSQSTTDSNYHPRTDDSTGSKTNNNPPMAPSSSSPCDGDDENDSIGFRRNMPLNTSKQELRQYIISWQVQLLP